jgi:hypothetical protein
MLHTTGHQRTIITGEMLPSEMIQAIKVNTLTLSIKLGSRLLVLLISIVRLFLGAAIQNTLSRKLGSEVTSCSSWGCGRMLGPWTARAGAD